MAKNQSTEVQSARLGSVPNGRIQFHPSPQSPGWDFFNRFQWTIFVDFLLNLIHLLAALDTMTVDNELLSPMLVFLLVAAGGAAGWQERIQRTAISTAKIAKNHSVLIASTVIEVANNNGGPTFLDPGPRMHRQHGGRNNGGKNI
ncbi:hypothetical protein EDD21DRAFT_391436 [Dissophora ornata]|nr:hypothetical protein EDD21DRAFT_391436 [Dissophora ornata]